METSNSDAITFTFICQLIYYVMPNYSRLDPIFAAKKLLLGIGVAGGLYFVFIDGHHLIALTIFIASSIYFMGNWVKPHIYSSPTAAFTYILFALCVAIQEPLQIPAIIYGPLYLLCIFSIPLIAKPETDYTYYN